MRRFSATVLGATVLAFGGALFANAGAAIPDDSGPKRRGAHEHADARALFQLPPSRENVDLVGKVRVSGFGPAPEDVAGHVADVASLSGRPYAYLGAWALPRCGKGGVYLIDISNPRRPREVEFIPTSEGSLVGEGVQVIHLDTRSFRGDLLLHNNEICGEGGLGGMSLWNVTNPRDPQPLARHVGDTSLAGEGSPNTIHSVFGWQQGNRAFAVLVDNEEAGVDDVDIFEITNPRAPVHIAEVGIPDWPEAQNEQALGMGSFSASFIHDLVVRRIGGNWLMLVSYWDAGYLILNVNDPSNPVFVNDSDYPEPDPLTRERTEANAHYAEFDRTGRLILAADEDFDRFHPVVRIRSGSFVGSEFDAIEDFPPLIAPGRSLLGLTRYVGRACGPVPAAAAPEEIAVAERGDCGYTEKEANARAAGYAAVIVFNNRSGGDEPGAPTPPCEEVAEPTVFDPDPPVEKIPLVFVARSFGFALLNVAGYNPASCPGGVEPPLPALGAAGAAATLESDFDGWGYLRLFDARTLAQLDAYAVPESLDPRYQTDFGDLTIHETATDPTHDVTYVSWYHAGFRVFSHAGRRLREVGHHIDERGNNLWGVEVHFNPDGRRYVLASDRDYGLYIYRFGTDLRPRKVATRGVARVGQTFSYRLRIANAGTIVERRTLLRDRLPRGVRFLSAFASQGRCSYRARSRTVVCNLGRLVDDGGAAFVTIRVRATRAGLARNTVALAGREVEYDSTNNRASARTRILRAPAPRLTGSS